MRWTLTRASGATSAGFAAPDEEPPARTGAPPGEAPLGRWPADDPAVMQGFLQQAQGLADRINRTGEWRPAPGEPATRFRADGTERSNRNGPEAGQGVIEPGEWIALPVDLHRDRSLKLARPLLGHSVPRSPEPAWWRRCLPGAVSGRGQDNPSPLRRIVNASEIWPGLIMSGTPLDQRRYALDWLAALAENDVGLVLDLRTAHERAAGRFSDCLRTPALRSHGLSATLNVEPAADPPTSAIELQEEAQPHAVTLALSGADGTMHRTAFQVCHVPLETGKMLSTDFLRWTASEALKLKNSTAEVRSRSVMVQSAHGMSRCAPVLVAIRLLQLLGDGPLPRPHAEQLVASLAAELRQRRGPSMVWTPQQLAPLLALAQSLIGVSPAVAPAEARKQRYLVSVERGPEYAARLTTAIVAHRAQLAQTSGRSIRLPGQPDPKPAGDADAAPPPTTAPPSRTA